MLESMESVLKAKQKHISFSVELGKKDSLEKHFALSASFTGFQRASASCRSSPQLQWSRACCISPELLHRLLLQTLDLFPSLRSSSNIPSLHGRSASPLFYSTDRILIYNGFNSTKRPYTVVALSKCADPYETEKKTLTGHECECANEAYFCTKVFHLTWFVLSLFDSFFFFFASPSIVWTEEALGAMTWNVSQKKRLLSHCSSRLVITHSLTSTVWISVLTYSSLSLFVLLSFRLTSQNVH